LDRIYALKPKAITVLDDKYNRFQETGKAFQHHNHQHIVPPPGTLQNKEKLKTYDYSSSDNDKRNAKAGPSTSDMERERERRSLEADLNAAVSAGGARRQKPGGGHEVDEMRDTRDRYVFSSFLILLSTPRFPSEDRFLRCLISRFSSVTFHFPL
jgi:hypothetical protein